MKEIRVIGQRTIRRGIISLISEQTFTVNTGSALETFYRGAVLRTVSANTYDKMIKPLAVEPVVKGNKVIFAPVVR